MSKITLKTVSSNVQTISTNVEALTKDIENLAAAVNRGFQATQDMLIKHINDKTDALESKLGKQLTTIENEVSDIKLSLDNKANTFDLKELDKRTTKLEIHTGIK